MLQGYLKCLSVGTNWTQMLVLKSSSETGNGRKGEKQNLRMTVCWLVHVLLDERRQCQTTVIFAANRVLLQIHHSSHGI